RKTNRGAGGDGGGKEKGLPPGHMDRRGGAGGPAGRLGGAVPLRRRIRRRLSRGDHGGRGPGGTVSGPCGGTAFRGPGGLFDRPCGGCRRRRRGPGNL